MIDRLLGRKKLREDNEHLRRNLEHNNASFLRMIADRDAEIKRLKKELAEAMTDDE